VYLREIISITSSSLGYSRYFNYTCISKHIKAFDIRHQLLSYDSLLYVRDKLFRFSIA